MSKRWEEASAYMRQASSNQALSDYLFQKFCARVEERKEEFWCHVVAQCQQSVEKSLKAALCLGNLDFPKTHRSDQLLFILLHRLHALHLNEGHLKKLSKLFGAPEKKVVQELSLLAPQKNLTKRNTEYPFRATTVWIAPAEARVFPRAEVELFVKQAKRIVLTINQIVSATPFLPSHELHPFIPLNSL